MGPVLFGQHFTAPDSFQPLMDRCGKLLMETDAHRLILGTTQALTDLNSF